MREAIVGKISLHDIAAGRFHEILQRQLGPKLIEAAKTGNVAQVRKLLKIKYTAVNAADTGGRTALIWAVINRKIEVVKELLKNEKVDVNAAATNGYTALMVAAENNNIEVVKLIMDKLGWEGIEITIP